MTRSLNTTTLDGAARHYAAMFLQPERKNAAGRFVTGPAYIRQDFFNFTYKDEFTYLMEGIRQHLGKAALVEFDELAKATFTPREDEVFEALLAEKLAIDPKGGHIAGKIGAVVVGGRRVGTHLIEVETPDSIRFRKRMGLKRGEYQRETMQRFTTLDWPIYAGEEEERVAKSGVADEFPLREYHMALNTRISNEVALLMCDACVDNLDEGAGAAVIEGRTGAQPADPDTTVTGTLLFTLTCSATAFGNAADAAPGGVATASAITDDSSADATDTLSYCRASSTTTPPTPLDDHIDGEAGTSGADFNFNTLSIVSGSTVSMTAWTVTQPET